MPPSETDPLLPQGSSAPEISGYGFSRPSKAPYFQTQTEVTVQPESEGSEGKDDDQFSSSSGGFSPLRTLITLFTIVVGVAIIITLLVPGALDSPWHAPRDDTTTIHARVNKILAHNPLIGPLQLHASNLAETVLTNWHQMVIMTLPFSSAFSIKTTSMTKTSPKNSRVVACMLKLISLV